jgi:hypothetical protein
MRKNQADRVVTRRFLHAKIRRKMEGASGTNFAYRAILRISSHWADAAL